MKGPRKKAASIDDYIKDYPKEVQEIMQKLRMIVKVYGVPVI